jgi:DNA-binding PucR family transcriptional regulator
VASSYAEAARCAATLAALGRSGTAASAEQLGFFGLLVGEHRDVRGFVTTTLGPVLDYDARRGTELRRTLQAWFDAGGSPARAAEALKVHVNTVAQRLDRIGRLLGADWTTPARVLEVQLALKLHGLTGALGG